MIYKKKIEATYVEEYELEITDAVVAELQGYCDRCIGGFAPVITKQTIIDAFDDIDPMLDTIYPVTLGVVEYFESLREIIVNAIDEDVWDLQTNSECIDIYVKEQGLYEI